ncbi:gamma-glutamylcyclotransferase [uncultured Roseovarius sp.]|uniref:gamma-glutamylcyclotransferase n=1 Tax=uncultured Roseovarius sp. TaxID=293344 RepID=UPI002604B41E|nr:gamma-glutamylcyclotransferase [uncultured Roseovarius sp.]
MNRDTHAFEGARTASLRGWRRIWRYTTQRQVAYLTVIRDASTTIDGLIAPVPDQDWGALDYRERAYARVPAAHQITHTLPHQPQIAVYAIPDNADDSHAQDHTLLLSYIDVVVQGYLREFGAEGAARFFASTSGWDAPIVDDRAAPRYPRHCRLTPEETALVDVHLANLRVRIVDA